MGFTQVGIFIMVSFLASFQFGMWQHSIVGGCFVMTFLMALWNLRNLP